MKYQHIDIKSYDVYHRYGKLLHVEIFFTANTMYADGLQTCIINKNLMFKYLNQHQTAFVHV